MMNSSTTINKYKDRTINWEPEPNFALQESATQSENTKILLLEDERSLSNSLLSTGIETKQSLQQIKELFAVIFSYLKEGDSERSYADNFSRDFIYLLTKYGEIVTETVITDLIIGEQISPDVASELLNQLGQINKSVVYLLRRRLLERCLLSCRLARVRYGALLGLAYMDDLLSANTIKIAMIQETVPSLKQDMLQLLSQLENVNMREL